MMKLFSTLFSVTTAGFLLLFLAFVLGFATFVENVHGTEAARALVYNSRWLEVIFLILTVSMIYSLFRFRLYKKEKLTIGLFHIAFILILIGAGITRYFGKEGIMHIREGESSSEIVTSDQWFHLALEHNGEERIVENNVNFSPFSVSEISENVKIGGKSIDVKSIDYLQNIAPSSTSNETATGGNAVKVRLTDGGKQKVVTVWNNQSGGLEPTTETFEGVNYKMWIGPKKVQLPFSIKLNDFILERYPGSNSPSSYESKVVLIDPENGINRDERIFMNNVLKHRSYRFYQSSYDTDEQGTVLSVNNDAAGTFVTYFGYILLFLGILLSIFNPKSYFFQLMKKASVPVTALLILAGLGESFTATANDVPRESAKEFAKVWVQGHDGRVKPFSTLAYEAVMKMSRMERIDGMTPEQVVLGMAADPQKWQTIPIITVSESKIKEVLGITGGKAAYIDFFDSKGNYKLAQAVNEAYGKQPSQRGTFDNGVIKTDERLNVAYMVFNGNLFRFFPSQDDGGLHWSSPNDVQTGIFGSDSILVAFGFSEYLKALNEGSSDKETILLATIKDYQQKYGSALIPGKTKQQLEILYNRINIFKDLSLLYLLCGFAALFFFFRAILTGKEINKKGVLIVFWIFVAEFVLHTLGLAVRGYISGHMPWSDGYESMIYIAWAGMLAGLVFARRNPMILGAAAILSGLTLFVAQMSWLNPEITNLVPVLKSYWLTFHVAIITASYGFVGICALIGLLNLVMAAIRTPKNSERINRNIQQMTMINQAAMILGLYFLTIGTFLGGIWANESWGRYWGWDPKETWSLVTILIYTFITHIRLMPGFRGWFAFNLASVIGLLSVLMTYLGVNYYLSGLHSYGSGSGLSFPAIIVVLFSLIGIIAYLAWRKIPSGDLQD
jgi:cytochrome c-type biogenesis protein CcsB